MRQLICYIFFFCTQCSFLFSSYGANTPDNSSSVEKILSKIESKMKSIKTLKCSFIQEKKLSIMKKPIIITGKIYIQAPSYFAWFGDKPVKYYLVIKGHILKQWDEDSNKIITIDLESKPMFQVILSQMSSWFSGNYTKQADDYNIEVIRQDPLTLKFSPKLSSSISEYVKTVQVTFKKDISYIASITILEKNQDSMTISFNDIVLNRIFPVATWSIKRGI
jgi:outer membrane lipoprotein-sorting protein